MTRRGKETVFLFMALVSGIAALFTGTWLGLFGPALLFLFLYIELYAFITLFLETNWMGYCMTLFPIGMSAAFLPPNPWIYAGVIAAGTCGVLSWHQVREERRVTLGFSLWKLLRASMPAFLTAIAIIISLFYWHEHESQENLEIIPRNVVKIVLPYVMKGFIGTNEALTNIDPNKSVKTLLQELIESEARKNNTTLNNQAYINSLIEEERVHFEKELGISININEPIGDLFYRVANKEANNFLGPYIQYLPIALSVGVFFAIKALSLPIQWLTTVIIWGLVSALRKSGFVKESGRTVSVISYSL